MTTFPRQQTIKKLSAPTISPCLSCGRASAGRSLQRTSEQSNQQQKLVTARPISLDRSVHDFGRVQIYPQAPVKLQAKLAVNAPGDACEQEADRIAEQVVRGAGPEQPSAVRGHYRPAPMEASALVQAKQVAGNGIETAAAPPMIYDALRAPGQPLDTATRIRMESRFGHDFSRVRVHTGREAIRAAQVLQARAFTVGSDIFFKPGQFAPHTHDGARLLAHELTHTLQQQASSAAIQRDPDVAAASVADPVCTTFNFLVTRLIAVAQAMGYHVSKSMEGRLKLIRTLKMIRRCATTVQQDQLKQDLSKGLGAKVIAELWAEAGTAFGGYTGMYPEYAPDIKGQLEKLGTSQTFSFGKFKLSGEGTAHRSGAKKVAEKEIDQLARTDIVYFRGHQFAQYRAPGLFSDGSETYGFDLRYIEQSGGFSNVKLMISTSCATICKEAFEVFHGLFPNAVILGYRKSAPLDGAKVRNTFRSKIEALSRPLLLDQAVDVSAIIAAWKSTVESVHAGNKEVQAGYYQNGTIHYWDGSAWQTTNPLDEANKCKRKGDFRDQYPAPRSSGAGAAVS